MKLFRLEKKLVVTFNDGSILSTNECTDEMYKKVTENQDNEDFIKELLAPNLKKLQNAYDEKIELINADFKESKYLTKVHTSLYIESVSQLSVPIDLAAALYKAEKENNQELIDTYINFWTLVCLNKDSRARMNLFWFLNKYGMLISKSGLFVAYRNVEIKQEGNEVDVELSAAVSSEFTRVKYKLKKSPKNYFFGKDKDGNYVSKDAERKLEETIGNLFELYEKLSSEESVATIYTDSYTRSMEIKLGQTVHISRSKCDTDHNNTCSKGLHVAGKSWLKNGYFGKVSLMVLVNPADVVAVPPKDDYGKMRVCAYYPVSVVKRDENGDIIDEGITDGFENDFINVSYDGNIQNEELEGHVYTLEIPEIPEIPEINRLTIHNRLEKIKSSLSKKVI